MKRIPSLFFERMNGCPSVFCGLGHAVFGHQFPCASARPIFAEAHALNTRHIGDGDLAGAAFFKESDHCAQCNRVRCKRVLVARVTNSLDQDMIAAA